jgi:hypothetical protein
MTFSLQSFLIDEGGLASFVEEQFLRWPVEDWDWADLTSRIWHLSDGYWQPNPDYVQGIYVMQKERAGEVVAA